MLAFDIEASDLRLNEEHARAWAAALGDIRLVLADRLHITDEERADEIGTITDASQVTNQEGIHGHGVQLHLVGTGFAYARDD